MTFTASASSSTSTAYAVQSPLGLASAGADFGADKPTSVADLAAQRNQSLAAEVTAIYAAQAEAVAAQRAQAMDQASETLDSENRRLLTLSKFLWPTKGEASSVFGKRLHPILRYYRMHDGDDIGASCGQPIWATQSGVVTKAESGYGGGSGNNVWIDHGHIKGVNVSSGYLHMSQIDVKVGQQVTKGDVIGTVGSTGLSTACHLHFSIKKNGAQSDPMEYVGWTPEGQRAPSHN